MSRVGRKPIYVPEQAQVTYKERKITVKADKGILTRSIHSAVELDIKAKEINVYPVIDDRKSRALQGLTRSLLANMVEGVTKGFERILEINGIGYRAMLNENSIEFHLGYSHSINFDLPEGVFASVDKKNVIKLTGIDKELLGQTAAAIRRLRPPEHYKGKGIKYKEEYIQRKAGKTGAKAI